MIIRKITEGFVTQRFDTEKNAFVSQSFTAGDGVEYETDDGNVNADELMPNPEPYLPFDMVQPNDS